MSDNNNKNGAVGIGDVVSKKNKEWVHMGKHEVDGDTIETHCHKIVSVMEGLLVQAIFSHGNEKTMRRNFDDSSTTGSSTTVSSSRSSTPSMKRPRPETHSLELQSEPPVGKSLPRETVASPEPSKSLSSLSSAEGVTSSPPPLAIKSFSETQVAAVVAETDSDDAKDCRSEGRVDDTSTTDEEGANDREVEMKEGDDDVEQEDDMLDTSGSHGVSARDDYDDEDDDLPPSPAFPSKESQMPPLPPPPPPETSPGGRRKQLIRRNSLEGFQLRVTIRRQLLDFVRRIASLYHNVHFHSFIHATHVTLAANHVLKSMDADVDPWTHFCVVFAALVHDVDHRGVTNRQLLVEDPNSPLVRNCPDASVAERNSIAIAMRVLNETQFRDLRKAIWDSSGYSHRSKPRFFFGSQSRQRGFVRRVLSYGPSSTFENIITSTVLATDIASAERRRVGAQKWVEAFGFAIDGVGTTVATQEAGAVDSCLPDLDEYDPSGDELRQSVILDLVLQAADVSHTMQQWETFVRWNQRLYNELYAAHKAGRGDNPSPNWNQSQIMFFDKYVIPLAERLDATGVLEDTFGRTLLESATANRNRWKREGERETNRIVSTAATFLDTTTDRFPLGCGPVPPSTSSKPTPVQSSKNEDDDVAARSSSSTNSTRKLRSVLKVLRSYRRRHRRQSDTLVETVDWGFQRGSFLSSSCKEKSNGNNSGDDNDEEDDDDDEGHGSDALEIASCAQNSRSCYEGEDNEQDEGRARRPDHSAERNQITADAFSNSSPRPGFRVDDYDRLIAKWRRYNAPGKSQRRKRLSSFLITWRRVNTEGIE